MTPTPSQEERRILIERLRNQHFRRSLTLVWEMCEEAAKALEALDPPTFPVSEEGARECLTAIEEALWVTVYPVETVTGTFLTEPGEPFWRIEVDGFCADFDYPEAANNFALAVNARISLAAFRGSGVAPEGFVLVPRVPTEAMIRAFDNAKPTSAVPNDEGGWSAPYLDAWDARYAAMIAAAPDPQNTPDPTPLSGKD